ncbi:MAG: CinA family nicotinamide mononucleotide deamidase-related protein [Candidatus Riflebacteria bacterium]|nr:CinA family nicotinamide mononucleotide deamidase-related protein [Candidatus Riflebacteria bacterium]
MNENKPLVAEIISVGTELLLGEIADTNSQYLSRRLRDLGIYIYHKSVVGDNKARIISEIKNAAARSDIIILGGGLGPTEDDLTRDALAEYLGEEMYLDEAMFEEIKAMFLCRQRIMPDSNKKQAMIVPSADFLPNPVGTAPGWIAKKNGKIFITLPGPPEEQKRVWHEAEQRLPVSKRHIYCRTIRTSGIGESHLAEMIKDYTLLEDPVVGIYCRDNGIDVRISSASDCLNESKIKTEASVEKLSEILKPFVYGYDEETIGGVALKKLAESGESLAVFENITEGLLTDNIMRETHWKSAYKGTLILPDAFTDVSEKTAIKAAKQARKQLSADWGLAITGIPNAEPEKTASKITAAIALASSDIIFTAFTKWAGTPEMVKQRAVRTALNLLRDSLEAGR